MIRFLQIFLVVIIDTREKSYTYIIYYKRVTSLVLGPQETILLSKLDDLYLYLGNHF